MSSVDLKTYLPTCYDGIIEEEAEQDALSVEINKFDNICEQAMNDQFIQTCSLKAIGYYEACFHIIADPASESLEFRKERVLNRMKILQPPYTYWYLRKILDIFFGEGRYQLEIDENLYKITLESSCTDSNWYHEIQVSIMSIKPCNMIFINMPRVTENLLINETVKSSATTRRYILDGRWQLGLFPFVSVLSEETNKMANVSSIKPYFITKNLENMEDLIGDILINNSTSITNLNTSIENSNLIIQYGINHETVTSITNIKIRDANNITLSNSNVFIPVDDYVIIKHIINLKEGVNDE